MPTRQAIFSAFVMLACVVMVGLVSIGVVWSVCGSTQSVWSCHPGYLVNATTREKKMWQVVRQRVKGLGSQRPRVPMIAGIEYVANAKKSQVGWNPAHTQTIYSW